MSDFYNPADWYWLVGAAPPQAWSSARVAYVPLADAAYQAWLAAGNTPTAIDTEASLTAVLLAQYPAGAPGRPSVIPSLAFLARFTAAETAGIHTAALANPPTAASLALQLFLLKLGAATVANLGDPDVRAALDALVAAGLLTAARKTALLTP